MIHPASPRWRRVIEAVGKQACLIQGEIALLRVEYVGWSACAAQVFFHFLRRDLFTRLSLSNYDERIDLFGRIAG